MKKYILIILIPFLSHSQEISFEKYKNSVDPNAMTMKAIEVKNNLYIIEGIGGGVGNVGVVIGEDGIIMIDNQFEILEDLNKNKKSLKKRKGLNKKYRGGANKTNETEDYSKAANLAAAAFLPRCKPRNLASSSASFSSISFCLK